MSEKTWKLQVNEDELKAIIEYHRIKLYGDPTIETSARIHDLTKRLNRKDDIIVEGNPIGNQDEPEIETKETW